MWVPCFVEIWMKGVADLVTSLNSESALKELNLAYYFYGMQCPEKTRKRLYFQNFSAQLLTPIFEDVNSRENVNNKI